MTRRHFVYTTGSGLAGSLLSPFARGEGQQSGRMTLGYSSYALPDLSPIEAIAKVAHYGYDSLELCLFTMETLPSQIEQQEIQARCSAAGLRLPSFMENLKPLGSEQDYLTSTERLRKVCDLANQFTLVPLIQTVLGGKDWVQQQQLCRDRVGRWQEIASDANVVLAIKPHRGHALSRPAEGVWLIEQLGNSPWLRLCFDFSHFIYREMPLIETIEECLPLTAHVAVKDAEQKEGQVVFRSPGDVGTIDYEKLIRRFHQGGYRGDVCVEVSRQVWNQPGYDADATLAKSYQVLSQAFRSAGILRS